ncbi:uncharacterized protein [Gossypium hirsutum]|uniref:Uncharacterized protein n=1 Tax=Gossypium hirsutum TaxID=3635 RepID=A0A1U8IJP6_GOSHI|nr:uncharacterized protein LOC107895891 [Gossypium hirsutum]
MFQMLNSNGQHAGLPHEAPQDTNGVITSEKVEFEEFVDASDKEVLQIVTHMPNALPSKILRQSNLSAQADVSLPLPFPQRIRKNEHDKQYQQFLNTLKPLQINILLVNILVQILSYGKFMKDLLSKKKKLTDIKTVTLIKGCSVVLASKLPPKLNDPGSFTIPCSIGNHYLGKTLSELGASINLMPLSIYRKLGISHMKSTAVTLQLIDRSLAQPEEQIKDILIRVDKFIFLADFIILDYEADKEVPIILG